MRKRVKSERHLHISLHLYEPHIQVTSKDRSSGLSEEYKPLPSLKLPELCIFDFLQSKINVIMLYYSIRLSRLFALTTKQGRTSCVFSH